MNRLKDIFFAIPLWSLLGLFVYGIGRVLFFIVSITPIDILMCIGAFALLIMWTISSIEYFAKKDNK